MRPAPVLITLTLLATALAGCHEPGHDGCPHPGAEARPVYQEMGFDGNTWPRLDGQTVRILDHGAFGAFDDAKQRFEALTGATVEHFEADDTGSALQRAVLEKGNPTFDVLYGIDNVLICRALAEDLFLPYRPLLADRIDPSFLFFDRAIGWPATPVDHGYIAINWDPAHPDLSGGKIDNLADVAAFAETFVTPDPRTSTPGLGFLIATIDTHGDQWPDYWTSLFERDVLITSGWSDAYEQHFSGGYGPAYGGLGDRAIVTSYTTSPAYEAYYGRNETELAHVVTAPKSTFHQVETMGIVRGTQNLAAAQAWIEFTLSDGFQSIVASHMAVYPVVEGVSTDDVYGRHDPRPGSFQPATIDHVTLGANVQTWVQQWTELCEQHDCA